MLQRKKETTVGVISVCLSHPVILKWSLILQVVKNEQKTKMSFCVVFVQDVQASCIPNISVQPYSMLENLYHA